LVGGEQNGARVEELLAEHSAAMSKAADEAREARERVEGEMAAAREQAGTDLTVP